MGQPPTVYPPDLANAIMLEIANYIESRGIVLNPPDNTQLTQAIDQQVGSSGVLTRNKIINPSFSFWQRIDPLIGATALPVTGIGPPAYVVDFCDRWYFTAGVGGAATVERQDFALGQTDVPGNPKHFLEWVQTTGATADPNTPMLAQAIEDVTTGAGQVAVVTFYARVTSGTQTPAKIDFIQFFGAGGSADVQSATAGAVTSPVIDTTWKRFEYAVTLPSVAGKTITQNDFVMMRLRMMDNETFTLQVADFQVEFMETLQRATDFERRRPADELQLCQRFYEKNTLGDLPVTNVAAQPTNGWTINYDGGGAASVGYIGGLNFAVPKRTVGVGAGGPFLRFYDTGVVDTIDTYDGATAESGRGFDTITIGVSAPELGIWRAPVPVAAGVKLANGNWACDCEFNT